MPHLFPTAAGTDNEGMKPALFAPPKCRLTPDEEAQTARVCHYLALAEAAFLAGDEDRSLRCLQRAERAALQARCRTLLALVWSDSPLGRCLLD